MQQHSPTLREVVEVFYCPASGLASERAAENSHDESQNNKGSAQVTIFDLRMILGAARGIILAATYSPVFVSWRA